MLTGKKAQSTLEYIIIFTTIVGAILFAANTFIKSSMQDIFNRVSNQMEQAVDQVNFEGTSAPDAALAPAGP